jgi:hypothetical protein
MKNHLFICINLLLILSLHADRSLAESVIRLSEPVAVSGTHETFGSLMGSTDQMLSLPDIIQLETDYAGKEIVVKTRIDQVCRKKGCFFIAQSGSHTIRITFIDYSFFIPTDSSGKEVVVRGIFNSKHISEAQARHFAEDAGGDPQQISGDQFEYTIVASSVMIPLSR